MALKKLEYRPGINREGSDYSNEGGWYDGDKIRFRSGFPEKIGGWIRLSASTFLGTARSMWNWIDLDGANSYLGIGTHLKYYIEKDGVYYDITPIRKTTSPMGNNPFATMFSTLDGAIDDVQTTLSIVSAASFANIPGTILIDTEQISYTGVVVASNILLGLTRGVNGTVAATHLSGANVGGSSLKVSDTANGALTNDFVTFSGASTTGGFTAAQLNTDQQIISIFTANIYVITIAGTFATSATAGGGATVVATYLINSGSDVAAFGLGYGIGPYGRLGYGDPVVGGTTVLLRLWSNDNYGSDLLIAPRGGAIYYWKDSTGVSVRAVLLQTLATAAGEQGTYVPNATYQVLTSSVERFVIALGANPYIPGNASSTFDPLLVRWSDQLNPYQWIPSITNQSGEYHLSRGSYIVAARIARVEILIWTDSTLYSMQYLGPPYVWGFNTIQDNISVMSPNAIAIANNVVYWMGTDKFYIYSGRVETLPCSVKQYVFENINKDQASQVFAGTNEGYNEIWFFYCSQDSLTIDRYVIYNYVDRVWYTGSMARTAWLDSGIRKFPMAVSYDNRVLYHEAAVDDLSGDVPVVINAYVQSSDFDIEDGDSFGFVWRILPDINFNGSNISNPYVTMTVKPRRNSGEPYGTADMPQVNSQDDFTQNRVYVIQEFDGQVYTRLRGRQMSFRVESNTLGVAWQLGMPRLDLRKDGRR